MFKHLNLNHKHLVKKHILNKILTRPIIIEGSYIRHFMTLRKYY